MDVVLRQTPSILNSVISDGRYSSLRAEISGNRKILGFLQTRKFQGLVCNNNEKQEFSDKGHVSYYNCGGLEKEKVKAMKKKAKVLKSLTKNLNMFSSIGFGLDLEAGLVAEIQNKTISEATEILVKQLEQLKAEEKLMKRQKKEEKAKAKAMKMMMDDSESSSSSSSESSDSDCGKGKVVDMSSFRNNVVSTLEPVQVEGNVATLLPKKLEGDVSSCKSNVEALELALMQTANPVEISKTVEAVSAVGAWLKRVEVCMGGKCKKSGGGLLLDEFQKAMTGREGSAVACKCLGKCRDGPNVRVMDETTDAVMTDSVRMPSKTVCVGVGLQDVEAIVTSFFGEESSREGLDYVAY